MKTLLLCATLVLALAPTAISAAKSCASITKGQQCKNAAGCKWDFKTGAKWKSCSGIVVEDETDAVEDATDVVIVSGCWKFDKKRKCERKGCDWTKEGKSFKSCNDPAPRPSTIAPADPTAAAAPKVPTDWDIMPGCCRVGGKQVDVLYKETYSAVTATDADAMCANQCVDVLNCTAYEMTKKKKAKKNKRSPSKFVCELHDSAIDSVSRSTKSCRAATTSCNIHVSGFKLNDTTFNDAIAACLAEDPVGGECVNSTYGPMASWDVSDVTDYSYAFLSRNLFNGKIGGWNTAAGTTFEGTFLDAATFNQELKDWDTKGATKFQYMFASAAAFNQELKNWDTKAATSFSQMFSGAVAFNQELNDWDTGASTSFADMFYGAEVFNQELNAWDTKAATTFANMFRGAAVFNQPINAWDTEASTSFAKMFSGAAVFNQPLNAWVTKAATSFSYMFKDAAAFNQELNEWDTGAATSFVNMFASSGSSCTLTVATDGITGCNT